MMRATNRLFPIALVALMGLLTIWLDQVSKLGRFGNNLDPAQPEYVSEHVTAVRFNDQGSMIERLTAKQLWQYPKQHDIHFIQGTLTNYKDGAEDTRLTAATGFYNSASTKAFFGQQARMTKPANANDPAVTLDGTAIWLDTTNRFASSKEAVSVHYGNSTADAIGFTYDYKIGLLNLLSSVRATYVK